MRQEVIAANVQVRARTANVLMHQPVRMDASMVTTESVAVKDVLIVTINAWRVRTLNAHIVNLDITHQV